jgi:hypothetical protein
MPEVFTAPESSRTKLRTMLATIERQLAALPAGPLSLSFAALKKELDLGPEPQLRACPVCGQHGMAAATLCGSCWATLTPPKH